MTCSVVPVQMTASPIRNIGESRPWTARRSLLALEGNAGVMKSNAACMGCHDKTQQRAWRAFVRLATSTWSARVTSPSVLSYADGRQQRDHSMGGGHDGGMLKRSIVFTLDAKTDNGKVLVNATLKNQQPHALPTAHRSAISSSDSRPMTPPAMCVGQNAPEHPAKDDPQAYFAYLLSDDAGKDAMPPTATQFGADTRLRPRAAGAGCEIPAEGVVLVRRGALQPLWKVLADKFQHLPEDLRSPRTIAVAEVRL